MDTSQINILSLISTDTKLKKVAHTGGDEYHGPCPFCGGADRFIVQPNGKDGGRWSCRHCSPKWGDAISYTQKRNDIDFRGAVEALGLKLDAAPRRPDRRILRGSFTPAPPATSTAGALKSDYVSLHDSGWQASADAFVGECTSRLWQAEGASALAYLRGRGLHDATMGAVELGYNPTDRNERWGELDVFLPAGVVIPWQIAGQYWRINIRRMTAEKGRRYMQPAGAANGLYLADDIFAGCTVVMVEGELDALAVRSGARSLLPKGLVAVATGTASGSRLLRWTVAVGLAEQVLLAFDTDKAGQDAAAWWLERLGSKAARLEPTAHDVNDMLKAGVNIADWIADAI